MASRTNVSEMPSRNTPENSRLLPWINTYGRNAPDAAKFGVGIRGADRAEAEKAAEAHRSSSNASAPRRYSER